jgi:hypothetical protein
VTLLQYNGLVLDTAGILVKSVKGLADAPDVSPQDQPLVARDGLAAGYDYLRGRTVQLLLDVTGTDVAGFNAAMTALSQAFVVGGQTELPLTFQVNGVAGGNQVRVNCRTRKFSPVGITEEWINQGSASEVAIELFATDPRKYSDAAITISLSVAATPGGFTFPITFPLTFGTGGTSGIVAVENLGNIASPPSFRIYGPITNPTLRNETTGKQLSLALVVASGDYVDIDVKNSSVLLNGTANRYSSLSSAQWWYLEPGINQIRYSASSGSSTVDMTYRSAWK